MELEPIEPVYRCARANQPIQLPPAPLVLSWKGQRFQYPGSATLRTQPRLQLVLRADVSKAPDILFRLAGQERATLKVQYGRLSRPTNVLLANSGGNLITGRPKPFADFVPNPMALTFCKDRRVRLIAVFFHVMNFPAFLSAGQGGQDLRYRSENGAIRLGRTVLEHGSWRIVFQTLPEGPDLVNQLRLQGGSAITHVGRITRVDGKSFRISEAEALLKELHLFLSFVRGTAVPVVLPVGFDADGRRVFEHWGLRLGTAWQPCVSWFDEHHGETMATLFPGFVDLIRDPYLGKATKTALYWYLRSNLAGEGAGVDGGVILSQAALERLSVAYLTKQGHSTRNRTAADLMRSTFTHLRIPVSIREGRGAIRSGSRKGLWRDLPSALTRVRNELVHPKPHVDINFRTVVPTVWNVAQWYIELAILRLSGYLGVYSNRLRSRWRGKVESVPWQR